MKQQQLLAYNPIYKKISPEAQEILMNQNEAQYILTRLGEIYSVSGKLLCNMDTLILNRSTKLNENQVIIVSYYGDVYLFDFQTEKISLVRSLNDEIIQDALYTGDKLYVQSRHNLFIMDRNFNIHNTIPIENVFMFDSLINSEDALFLCSRNSLLKYDKNKGVISGRFDSDFYISSSFTINNSQIYFSAFSQLYCVDSQTLQLIWKADFDLAIRITATPVVKEDEVLILLPTNELAILNRCSGKVKYKSLLPCKAKAIIHQQKKIYIFDTQGKWWEISVDTIGINTNCHIDLAKQPATGSSPPISTQSRYYSCFHPSYKKKSNQFNHLGIDETLKRIIFEACFRRTGFNWIKLHHLEALDITDNLEQRFHITLGATFTRKLQAQNIDGCITKLREAFIKAI